MIWFLKGITKHSKNISDTWRMRPEINGIGEDGQAKPDGR